VYLTEKEIFNQYEALKKTYDYFIKKRVEIKKLQQNKEFNSITFIGSGSSYCLCKSAEISTKIQLGIPAHSLAAGDLMLNFPYYENIIQNTLLVVPTRSGNTSEVVLAVQKAREKFNLPCISICAREESELAEIVDLSLEIPWAFDESVCQTRTVTNLYVANLLLIGIMGEKELLLEEIKAAIDNGDNIISQYTELLKEVSRKREWDKVIVLADAELEGIAEEGALAFKEISRIPANYHHILDVRHGPMVLIDDKTLIIIALSPHGLSYQSDLISDFKSKGAQVLTVGNQEENSQLADFYLDIPPYKYYAVRGIPFIFIPQAIAYFKAILEEINPDVPQGLDPWIEL
jgi:glutamine---fructose-6-phosphate transaminase (isomerizing)